MSKKDINVFEKHVEKMVLVIAGLVCLWFLFTRVLFSPHYVRYDNEKFLPSDIDDYIGKQAQELEDRLAQNTESKEAYKCRLDDYVALMESAITDVDVSLSLPQPGSKKTSVIRAYNLPQIGPVSEVDIEHLRAVAYVPVGMVNEENAYSAAESALGDIDFVTVEAKFDVGGLYESFNESFAGGAVRPEWRDPCLAEPVFAAVELQRQEQLANDSWSDWQTVPRAKVESRRKLFEVIEDVVDLPPGGIKVRLLQFKDSDVRADLLQPVSYKIASADQEWFPPSIHKELTRYQQNMGIQEKRQARDAEKAERDKERGKARQNRKSNKTQKVLPSLGGSGGRGGGGRGGGGRGGSSYTSTSRPTRSRSRDRRAEKERSVGVREVQRTTSTSEKYDFYGDLDEILIAEETNLSGMSEPLVFWAYDDTIEPEKVYRYRIRLGVFNPVAGTGQIDKQDESRKNKVVLWSKFSEATESVEVPSKLCFFPHEIQETSRIVTVRVCKYMLGYWYSRDFIVKPGETIGKVVASEPVETADEDVESSLPQSIDYSTGAVLVDTVAVNDWSGGKNLRPRRYFDMLYSFDGTNIEHIPVRSRYWRSALQAKYNRIRKSEKEPKESFRPWTSQLKNLVTTVTRGRSRGGFESDEEDGR